jgi:hypothetical protein
VANHEQAIKAKDEEITRLKTTPDIDVRIKVVFWVPGVPEPGYSVGNFYVRLELINKNDVRCTVDQYWMTLELRNGLRRLSD